MIARADTAGMLAFDCASAARAPDWSDAVINWPVEGTSNVLAGFAFSAAWSSQAAAAEGSAWRRDEH